MAGQKGQKRDNNNKRLRAIELAVEGKSWSEIAEDIGVSNQAVWTWRKDPSFQLELTKLQEAVFNETALNHSVYLKNGMITLNRIASNKPNQQGVKEFTGDQQLKAAIELVALTHRNIEVIKVVEQNRKVLEEYEANTTEES